MPGNDDGNKATGNSSIAPEMKQINSSSSRYVRISCSHTSTCNNRAMIYISAVLTTQPAQWRVDTEPECRAQQYTCTSRCHGGASERCFQASRRVGCIPRILDGMCADF